MCIRDRVILDGEFELDNGIRVLGANGVVIENMTAINYAFNGFFWLEADGYRGSYLTAYRNGDYGIYGFDSINGLLEHSYGAGSPDAGFYIGQCYPCTTVLDNVWSEHNGLGYSGTDSGGEMYVINSQFNNNRSGIVPNSGSYELCYPERETTLIGNVVFSNSQADTPAIENALLAHGTGITPAGGVANTIERNLVYDHERVGIAIAPFPEGNPNDVVPPEEDWAKPCDENRQRELTTPDPADLLFEEFLVWDPQDNIIRDNVISESGQADIGYGAGVTLDAGDPAALAELGNCFSGNTFETSQPNNIEALAPCDGEPMTEGWGDNPLDLIQLFTYEAPEPVDYKDASLPDIPLLDGMEDPENAPAVPAVGSPEIPDTDSITVPEGPIYER